VGRTMRRDYQRNPREFDGWLKANAVFGLILTIGVLAMALAGFYSVGQPDSATEFSSVSRVAAPTTAETVPIKNLPVQKIHDMSFVFPHDD
jgi:heme/copper-type cytochrome/quinol oxidase subunit 1